MTPPQNGLNSESTPLSPPTMTTPGCSRCSQSFASQPPEMGGTGPPELRGPVSHPALQPPFEELLQNRLADGTRRRVLRDRPDDETDRYEEQNCAGTYRPGQIGNEA